MGASTPVTPASPVTAKPRRLAGLPLGVRIFLMSSLLIALAVGAAVAVTSYLIQRIARRAIDEALQSSSQAQAASQEQRYERLQLVSRLFVADPSLTAYIAEAAEARDPRSILDLLGERREDVGFDFAIVLDSQGRVIARTDRPNAVGEDLSQRPLIAKAISEFEAAGVWQEGDRLYYAVAVPVAKEFDLLGFLVAGFEIGNDSAAEVKRISGTEVAFVGSRGGGPEVVATTLPEISESLTAELRAKGWMMGRVMGEGKEVPRAELSLRGEPWMANVMPLKDAAGKSVGAMVALASVARELAAYRQIEAALLAAGLVSVLIALFLSFAVARRLLRPVRRLLAAAEAARQGNYDQKIAADPGGRRDEVGQLASAFDHLLGDLREKRDMEAYVTELSRTLPEPAPARPILVGSQNRDVLLLAVELRRYARALKEAPEEVVERLTADLKRISAAVAARRGQVESTAGHRVLARFEGEGRAARALGAAAEILGADEDGDTPVLALAAGAVVAGSVAWRDQPERALVGLPVQQIESLLRESTPGDLVASREVHEELRESLEAAGYRLAPKRGLVSTQPLYVLNAAMAARVTGVRPAPRESGEGAASVLAGGVATLTGIAPGALMGQRFEILSVLGAGGMGVVYKARDRELDDLVALKMLKRDLWGDRSQLERLKSELKLARKITHPNVLRTYDFGEIDGVPYISMEYVRGVTLRYLLDQTRTLPYSAGLRLAKQLCAGLGAAHAVGVLHRDIKPENLILEPTGNAKLMDFGIARPVRRLTPGQTQEGWIVGTPLYLSPEQLQGAETDVRADIYSCGVVLYEIFAGRLPFTGPTPVEIMLKHLKEEPAPPTSEAGEVPARLQQIVLKCLRKDPDERYRSVDELLRDLEGLTA